MLMYLLYYCGVGVVFWVISFARRPFTRLPIRQAWNAGPSTLGPINVPPIIVVAVLCVLLLISWPFFAVQAIWK